MGKVFTTERILLALLVLLVLSVRLFQYLPLQNFSSDSYFNLRQAEHIAQTGLPIFHDSLSYSGRLYIFPPLFDYLLAGLSLLFEINLASKILMSICFAAIVWIVYLISKHISKSKEIAFICALFSGFVPVLYFDLTQINSIPFTAFLTLLLCYCFLKLEDDGFASLCVILSVLLLFTSPVIFLFLVACLVYFVIQLLHKYKPTGRETEMVLFLFFCSVWFYVLLYKKALFLHGFGVFENNTPIILLSAHFQELTFANLLYSLGFIPLILGVYGIYVSVFDINNKPSNFFISFTIVNFVFLWTKLITFKLGLIFLSLCLIIICSHTLKIIFARMANMKAEKAAKVIAGAVVLLFLLTSIAPFLQKINVRPQSVDEINAFYWMRDNLPANATVLSKVDEGFLITYFAQKQNVADNNFLFIKDANRVYDDVNSMYSSKLTLEAVRLLDEYSVEYIYLSKKTIDELGEASLFYAIESECFEKVYSNVAEIYKFNNCKI